MVVASNSYIHTSCVRFGVLGHLWSQNDVIMSWLRLTANSNCFPRTQYTYTKCLSTLICCPWAYGSSLKQLSTILGSDFVVLGHLWSQNDGIMSWLTLTVNSNCFPHPHLTVYKVFEHIDMLSMGIWQ